MIPSPEGTWLTSAGIDVGTSTTKLIVSRLKLARASGALSLPRFEISERELLYAGPVSPTPLRGTDEIDAEKLWGLLSAQLEAAGVDGEELKTGAVIITGETATKINASAIVHLLAERAGSFVVATAGADLEGILAGKGAGADKRSLLARCAVVNLDVGGGTANAAIFRRGKAVGTATYAVGGKLIELGTDGRVLSVSPSLRPWLRASGFDIGEGTVVSFMQLRELCSRLCADMLEDLTGVPSTITTASSGNAALLRLGKPPKTSDSELAIEAWTVSGGIGALLYNEGPSGLADTAVYGDIGPLLAWSLRECMARYPIRLEMPDQTVRATVIGAGMQSADISGATIYLDAGVLPLRNVPVVKLDLAAHESASQLDGRIAKAMSEGVALYGAEGTPPFALALAGAAPVGYDALQRMAAVLHEQYVRHCPESELLVVLCERDMAQALGQALRKRCGSRPGVLCVDQVRVEHGDYVDLGEPISGMMIPVVVKTLAFPAGKER